MSTTVTIYHNPRCTKSRQTLALLRERGIEPKIVEYLKMPPTKSQVRQFARMLDDTHALVRTKEAQYNDLDLSRDSNVDAIADAIVAHPILMERPLVVCGDKAAIGRPPESVLDILP